MKQYEMTVLIHPDLEMNLSLATDKVKKLVEDNGGKILQETNEGKHRLAYAVKKQNFAIYYYYDIELPPAAIKKISSTLNITDEILRYLLVSASPRKAKSNAKQKEQSVEDNETKTNEEE